MGFPAQCATVAARARDGYDEQAKKRQENGQERGRRMRKGIVADLPQSTSESGTARDQAGKALGVSGRTVDFAQGASVFLPCYPLQRIVRGCGLS
jgi:hypothetical protein